MTTVLGFLGGVLSGDEPGVFESLVWVTGVCFVMFFVVVVLINGVIFGVGQLRYSIEDLLTPVHPDDQPTVEEDRELHIDGNRKHTPGRAKLKLYAALAITFFCGMTFHWAACNPGA